MKFKLNDTVVVIAGKDKGKTGPIMALNHKNDKIVVQGVNIVTRHIKGNAQRPGEIVHKEGAIHASNVMLICPETKKRTRIGYNKTTDGKKERIAKVSKAVVDKKKPANNKS